MLEGIFGNAESNERKSIERELQNLSLHPKNLITATLKNIKKNNLRKEPLSTAEKSLEALKQTSLPGMLSLLYVHIDSFSGVSIHWFMHHDDPKPDYYQKRPTHDDNLIVRSMPSNHGRPWEQTIFAKLVRDDTGVYLRTVFPWKADGATTWPTLRPQMLLEELPPSFGEKPTATMQHYYDTLAVLFSAKDIDSDVSATIAKSQNNSIFPVYLTYMQKASACALVHGFYPALQDNIPDKNEQAAYNLKILDGLAHNIEVLRSMAGYVADLPDTQQQLYYQKKLQIFANASTQHLNLTEFGQDLKPIECVQKLIDHFYAVKEANADALFNANTYNWLINGWAQDYQIRQSEPPIKIGEAVLDPTQPLLPPANELPALEAYLKLQATTTTCMQAVLQNPEQQAALAAVFVTMQTQLDAFQASQSNSGI